MMKTASTKEDSYWGKRIKGAKKRKGSKREIRGEGKEREAKTRTSNRLNPCRSWTAF